jgi:hypothetical protein
MEFDPCISAWLRLTEFVTASNCKATMQTIIQRIFIV